MWRKFNTPQMGADCWSLSPTWKHYNCYSWCSCQGQKGKRAASISIFQELYAPSLYNNTSYFNDLKLYRLSSAAKLGKAVQLLPLPETFDDLEKGTVCEAAGWGKTEFNDDSGYLLEVNVTVLNRKQCAKHYISKEYKITENMMCTKVGPRGQDTCSGDSGGPLICKGVFSGVTSFGPKQCGQPNEASVFTRLTQEYIDWIYSMINK
ncbi:unnamed protein product [Staurois parvus]|uniref:Peptidase S1 domain-containing protein n=1 Tax=Staurois parvus TaxID=386267 RepID=A0ABN9CT96_9NEOB|nr:unnamed protein product [Staurois parvus]